MQNKSASALDGADAADAAQPHSSSTYEFRFRTTGLATPCATPVMMRRVRLGGNGSRDAAWSPDFNTSPPPPAALSRFLQLALHDEKGNETASLRAWEKQNSASASAVPNRLPAKPRSSLPSNFFALNSTGSSDVFSIETAGTKRRVGALRSVFDSEDELLTDNFRTAKRFAAAQLASDMSSLSLDARAEESDTDKEGGADDSDGDISSCTASVAASRPRHGILVSRKRSSRVSSPLASFRMQSRSRGPLRHLVAPSSPSSSERSDRYYEALATASGPLYSSETSILVYRPPVMRCPVVDDAASTLSEELETRPVRLHSSLAHTEWQTGVVHAVQYASAGTGRTCSSPEPGVGRPAKDDEELDDASALSPRHERPQQHQYTCIVSYHPQCP
ncbi:hypothetical protein FVE85_6027 [Porphyridium purpureum]|uniref:Uncharacterized protein n=1 Tax=Porphyridium purpureum TaxID=35688 RepID=A0A5J4Z5S6_PORPP|nr:hypothetical protein FVE85_6027 [Porphyridium purpureum]|eukprot:POR8382..scf295_1